MEKKQNNGAAPTGAAARVCKRTAIAKNPEKITNGRE